MAQSSLELADELTALRAQVEQALDAFSQPAEGCPARLAEAIRYSLLAPGKRIRPLLVLLAADACGGETAAAMPAACAVEMVHAYSLIHDDLPAMDDDDLRRGRPTCHKVYGEAMAILAGDALLARSFEILARHTAPAAAAARCCAVLGEAAGAAQLVGGQADDIEAASGLQIIEQLEAIHRRKTGAMIVASLQLGGLSAQAPPPLLAALAEYGAKLGLLFQITDDLLDVRGSEAEVGKRLNKDTDRGKLTFPGLLGVDESLRRAEELAEGAREALAPLGASAERLAAFARMVLERNR